MSLVFVVYAYTGWNTAAYIAGNLETGREPSWHCFWERDCGGDLSFPECDVLFVANFNELNGQNDVGNIVAIKLFGVRIGQIFQRCSVLPCCLP